jgi:hypothetical protein
MSDGLRPKQAEFSIRPKPDLRIEGAYKTRTVRIDHQHLAPGDSVVIAGAENDVVVVILRGRDPCVPDDRPRGALPG